jgi:GMC oxidoreductase
MAVGVEYLHYDRTERAMADSEVILCKGAFNSPRILMLSGIGPEPELATHGIPVKSSWPRWMSAQIYKTTREQGCQRGSKTDIRPAIAYNSIAYLITSRRPEV